jgi:acetoin utilization deacetylase AcuC-like enzyme/GNAT superfamily N-acetyltransferase
MFRIRRVYDDILPIDRDDIAQTQSILREQFPLVKDEEIRKLPEMLKNPQRNGFRTLLFVADEVRTNRVLGFALVLHDPELNFFYLDFVSAHKGMTGRGTGGALYQRVREEALLRGVGGIYFECLPDDPALSRNPEILKENVSRLRFYEAFGARPITGTAYETPVKPDADNPPYLVYDDLGTGKPLARENARKIVRSILEKKYAKYCPPEYTQMVVASIKDDPVRLRAPKYSKSEPGQAVGSEIPPDRRIRLVVSRHHEIHHVRERGYVQSPVRIKVIMKEIGPTGLFLDVTPRRFSEKHLERAHDRQLVSYLKRMSIELASDESIYPYVFPIRNSARLPEDITLWAGYYGIDTFTPLNGSVFPAAKAAVDCGLTAAESLLQGYRIAYALVRPPGHHAERRVFGGFCYFNTAAIAADHLARWGKVAVLDIDYHHGNGTQEIFYRRRDVLTVSIHGHPQFAYPYFSGFAEEYGEGEGRGYNVNFPLPENVTPQAYKITLGRALRNISGFEPSALVVCLGLDTAKGDPTGSWSMKAKDFKEMGRMIGSLRRPTLVVQEGGYNTRNLGVNAKNFFLGLYHEYFKI